MPSGEKLPICIDPSGIPINTTTSSNATHPAIPGTNLCDSEGEFNTASPGTGFGWTSAHPCAYIYFEAMQVADWDLSGAKPVHCAPPDPSTPKCGQPIVIGSSVDNGLLVHKPYPSGPVVQIVKPWCNGKFPKFRFIPCVNSYTWMNTKVPTSSLVDVLVQTYTPEIDMLKTGGSG